MPELYKTPFLRFVLPFVGGIILQYYLYINRWSIIIVSLGTIMMLLSFFVPIRKQFTFRWLFGFGFYLVLLSFGMFLTWTRQHQNAIPFTEAHQVYKGYVADLPQNKPNTIALEIQLEEYGRKIVCYLPKDSLSSTLQAGNRISFFGKILPFEKVGEIGHFDYANYMFNKGYCGYTFISEDLWDKEGEDKWLLTIAAAQTRQHILNFYKKLEFDDDEFALLSGLTVGYTTALSDSIIQDFRDSGVAHILAVSGLHVGIIYIVILSLLNFFPYCRNKQILIILLLWGYIFIVGLPPSAIRAGIMLSMFCLAKMWNKKVYSYNSIFLAAFLILVWNPLSFFDIGFHLSFISVLSIKFFMPPLVAVFKFKNKVCRYIFNLLSLSLAAQIGLLPLCLYYFGMFPLYFMYANLLIVPVVSVIIYLALTLFFVFCLKMIFGSILNVLIDFLSYSCKTLLDYIIYIAHFWAQAPFSSIHDVEISLRMMLLLGLFVILLYLLFKKLNVLRLNALFVCAILIVGLRFYEEYNNRDTLVIYKNTDRIKIASQRKLNRVIVSETTKNILFDLNGQKLLLLVNDNYRNKIGVVDPKEIDYLYIESDKATSILEFTTLFDVKNVILGNCLSSKTIKRLKQECEKKGIPYYDIYTKGNLTINF